jgi:hypothetical protein
VNIHPITGQPRKGDWIATASGAKFFPLDPLPSEVSIADIAHALSNQCRFCGHTREFYSVAEHCVYVSRLCAPEDALWGLLHDASEAYISDIARPVKVQPEMIGYRAIEEMLQGAIVSAFGLPEIMPESVRLADNILLSIEIRDLMPSQIPGWDKWQEKIPEDCGLRLVGPWSPGFARKLFLQRFADLTAVPAPAPVRGAGVMDEGDF